MREADDGRALDVCGGQRLELLLFRHQQRRRLVGTHDPWRMRIECHHDRGRTALAGDTADAIENLAMAPVDAVEVTERKHRLRPAARPLIVRKVDYVHATLLNRHTERPYLHDEPIIGQLHAGRQPRARRRVWEVVADVREVRALRRKTIDHRERLVHAEMRRVRTLA